MDASIESSVNEVGRIIGYKASKQKHSASETACWWLISANPMNEQQQHNTWSQIIRYFSWRGEGSFDLHARRWLRSRTYTISTIWRAASHLRVAVQVSHIEVVIYLLFSKDSQKVQHKAKVPFMRSIFMAHYFGTRSRRRLLSDFRYPPPSAFTTEHDNKAPCISRGIRILEISPSNEMLDAGVSSWPAMI